MRTTLTAVLALIATLAFTSTAFAQNRYEDPYEDEATDIQLGLTSGATPSTFAGDEFDNAEMKVGFTGGGRAIIPFNRYIGLQPEVLFSQRGTSFEESENEINLNYIQAPILVRVSAPLGPITPKIMAGPTVGVLTDGSVEVEGINVGVDTDDFSRLDVGAAVGAGVDIAIGPGTISLDARAGQSLTDITDEESDTFNRAYDLLAGYNFRF